MASDPQLEALCQQLVAQTPHDAWDLCWRGLYEAFGRPTSYTKKTFRWQLKAGVVEVALTNSRAGKIVIPFDQAHDAVPYFAEHRPPKLDEQGGIMKEGRHSNVASFSPSISWDRHVLYVRPQSVWELSRTIEIIQGLLDGQWITDVAPPDNDPPLQSLVPGTSPNLDGPSSSTRRSVYHRDGGKCRRCGSTEDIEFDHIIPRARGGSDSANNLELLCQACNGRKSDNI